MEEEADVKLMGLTAHPSDNVFCASIFKLERDGEEERPSSSSLIENPNEVDMKVFPTTPPMDVLPGDGPSSIAAPTKIGGIQRPCGHILENPSWERCFLSCSVIVPKECVRGHVNEVPCSTSMSVFKCMTIIPGASSCTHQRKCHDVDLTLRHYCCHKLVEINDMCAAGEHPLKVPCHLAAKLQGLTAKEREAVHKFPPCEEPFVFRCKRGEHDQSVPCHQRSLARAYDWKNKSCSQCKMPPPQPQRSVESILDEIWAFVERDDRGRKDYQGYLHSYIPGVLLPPSSISGLGREGKDVIIGKLWDRLEESGKKKMPHVVKTSSVLNYIFFQWKYLDDEKAYVAVMERRKNLVQGYYTGIETFSKEPSEEKGFKGVCNSIFRQWCGCYVEYASFVKSKMVQLLPSVDIESDKKATAMYARILQLSDVFLQSVTGNPLHSDEEFCVELTEGLGHNPEIKRAVVWTLLGILATLKDPRSALAVGKHCGDLISKLLNDLNIPISRFRGVVEDDEFFAWKKVLKSSFPRPSEMYEINNRIKNPRAKAWFRGLEVDNPTRKEFGDFYHQPGSAESGEGGRITLDILEVKKVDSSTISIKNEQNSTASSPAECMLPQIVGGCVNNSGKNVMQKRSSNPTNRSSTDKRTKMEHPSSIIKGLRGTQAK